MVVIHRVVSLEKLVEIPVSLTVMSWVYKLCCVHLILVTIREPKIGFQLALLQYSLESLVLTATWDEI